MTQLTIAETSTIISTLFNFGVSLFFIIFTIKNYLDIILLKRELKRQLKLPSEQIEAFKEESDAANYHQLHVITDDAKFPTTSFLVNKWEKKGLLEGLTNEVEKLNMAVILENQEKQRIEESKETVKALQLDIPEHDTTEYCFGCSGFVSVTKKNKFGSFVNHSSSPQCAVMIPKTYFNCPICNTKNEIYHKITEESTAAN